MLLRENGVAVGQNRIIIILLYRKILANNRLDHKPLVKTHAVDDDKKCLLPLA